MWGFSGPDKMEKGPAESCLGSLSDEDIQRIKLALRPQPGWSSYLPSVSFLSSLLVYSLVGAALYWFYHMNLLKKVKRAQRELAVKGLNEMNEDCLRKVVGEGNIPSWLTFPDFERVSWLNTILGELWPRISDILTRKAFELLNPSLDNNKPHWIAKISLHKFDLGPVPPQLTGAKAYSTGGSRGEIVIDFDFIWPGQQDIVLLIQPVPKKLKMLFPLTWVEKVIQPLTRTLLQPLTCVSSVFTAIFNLKAGVGRISFNGRARVSFKPLMSEMPIVEAVQLSLVEQPNFDFDITLYGGDISFMPGLELWMHSFIRESVLAPYVLPDHYQYVFVDRPLGELDKPKGILYVKLIEAVNVPHMDWLTESDPYVRLWVRNQRRLKSQIKHRSKNPKWNEQFEMLVHVPDHQYLEVELYDWDFLDHDDAIGKAQIAIRDLPAGERQDLWVEVQKPGEEDDPPNRSGRTRKFEKAMGSVKALMHRRANRGQCKVHLEMTYFSFETQGGAPGMPFESCNTDEGQKEQLKNLLRGGILYVRVKRALQLPKRLVQKLKKPRISVCVSVAGQEKWTAELKGTTAAWEEPLEYVISGEELASDKLMHQKIRLELFEHVFKKESRGHTEVFLQEVMEHRLVSHDFMLKGAKQGQLSVEMQWMGILEAG